MGHKARQRRGGMGQRDWSYRFVEGETGMTGLEVTKSGGGGLQSQVTDGASSVGNVGVAIVSR